MTRDTCQISSHRMDILASKYHINNSNTHPYYLMSSVVVMINTLHRLLLYSDAISVLDNALLEAERDNTGVRAGTNTLVYPT